MHKVSRSSVQLSTQPSPLDVASPDSSYIFLEKGNKTTSKFRESFNIIKVELPLFSPRFLQYQHTLSSINSIKNAKNFLRKVLIAAQFLFCQFLTNYLLKGEYNIFFYSCTYLHRVKQFPSYRLQVTDARTSWLQEPDRVWHLESFRIRSKSNTSQEQDI